MQSPKGIIAIAALFAGAAIYLWTIAIIRLISRDAISLMAGSNFLYGLELAGPYMFLLGGTVYGIIAWGLFRLHNWARWTTMLIIAFSFVPLVAKTSMAPLGVSVLWYGLQIALRVAVAWYLAQAPAAIDAFTKQGHGSTRIVADKAKQ